MLQHEINFRGIFKTCTCDAATVLIIFVNVMQPPQQQYYYAFPFPTVCYFVSSPQDPNILQPVYFPIIYNHPPSEIIENEESSKEQVDEPEKKRARQRFAFQHELNYKGSYQPEGGEFYRIRVWVNGNNAHYYDCDCGKRKPVQDLYKIKKHVLRHLISDYKCDTCGKSFNHHLRMNAHMRIHKKDPLNKNDLIINEIISPEKNENEDEEDLI